MVANIAVEKDKYFNFDRDISANANILVKTMGRTYNFIMWFFVRDSWMALLPRWCGAVLYAIAILRLFRVI